MNQENRRNLSDDGGNANNQPRRDNSSQPPETGTNANAGSENINRGVRGLDYPAFEFSSDSLFEGTNRASNSNMESNIFDTVFDSLNASSLNDERPPIGNLVVTVNYIFSDFDSGSRTGSLILSVPNIPNNQDDSTLEELVRIARNIALGTVSSTALRPRGTSIEKFNSFPIKAIESLNSSNVCPVCYDAYVPPKEKKKKINSNENHEHNTDRKRRKTEASPTVESDEEHIVTTPSTDSSSNSILEGDTSATAPSTTPIPNSSPTMLSQLTGSFLHLPIEMPCGHVFGKSCLFEWLKANTTCPLCRYSVAPVDTSEEANRNNDTANIGSIFENRSPNNQQQFVIITTRNGENSPASTNAAIDENELTNRIMEIFSRNGVRVPELRDTYGSIRPNSTATATATTPTSSTTTEQVPIMPVPLPIPPTNRSRPSLFNTDSIGARLRNRTLIRNATNSNSNPEANRPDLSQNSSSNTVGSEPRGNPHRTRTFFNQLFSNIINPRNRNARRSGQNNRSETGSASRPRIPGPSDSLFSMGVASRRTANGIETISLDNSNHDDDIIQDLIFNSSRRTSRRSGVQNNRSPTDLNDDDVATANRVNTVNNDANVESGNGMDSVD